MIIGGTRAVVDSFWKFERSSDSERWEGWSELCCARAQRQEVYYSRTGWRCATRPQNRFDGRWSLPKQLLYMLRRSEHALYSEIQHTDVQHSRTCFRKDWHCAECKTVHSEDLRRWPHIDPATSSLRASHYNGSTISNPFKGIKAAAAYWYTNEKYLRINTRMRNQHVKSLGLRFLAPASFQLSPAHVHSISRPQHKL